MRADPYRIPIRPAFADRRYVRHLMRCARMFTEEARVPTVGAMTDALLDMLAAVLSESDADEVFAEDGAFPDRGVIWDSEGNASIQPLRTTRSRGIWLALQLEDYADHLERRDPHAERFVVDFAEHVRDAVDRCRG